MNSQLEIEKRVQYCQKKGGTGNLAVYLPSSISKWYTALTTQANISSCYIFGRRVLQKWAASSVCSQHPKTRVSSPERRQVTRWTSATRICWRIAISVYPIREIRSRLAELSIFRSANAWIGSFSCANAFHLRVINGRCGDIYCKDVCI
jgi:hypothetical protein